MLHSAHEDRGGALNYTDLPVLSDHDVSAIQCVFFRFAVGVSPKKPSFIPGQVRRPDDCNQHVSTCPCIAAHASTSV